MLEHALWAPGHLTVRTIATRRAHLVEVDRDGRPVAEGDADGLLRALDGLVLAEAPLTTVDAAVDLTRPRPGRRPATAPADAPSLFADDGPTEAPPLFADDRRTETPSSGALASPGHRPADGPAAALAVEVFGHRQGWVVATRAVDRLRERALNAELVADGTVLGRLSTLGARGEEAVVRDVGGDELAHLARFDHLRGLSVTTSSWDLRVQPVEDPRLRVLALVAVLRLPALWSAAIGRDPRLRGRGRRRTPGGDGAEHRPA